MTLALVNILNRNFLFIKKIKNYIIILFFNIRGNRSL